MPEDISADLIACVDEARQCVADIELNPFRTFLVTITWDGGRVGSGTPSTVEDEILPPPTLISDDLRSQLRPSGLDEEQSIRLSGITRTRAEQELYDPDAVDRTNEKFLYKIIGARVADGLRARYYVPSEPPELNAGPKIGNQLSNCWTVRLRRVLDPQ